MGGEVFINYRGDDSHSYGALLYRELSRRFGRDSVFLDSESIPAGADFVTELAARARQCRVLLAVIGPSWLTATGPDGRRRLDDPDDWIRRELAEAFAAGVTVIPVLTDQGELPDEEELPADIAPLARRQYRMLRHRDATADLARIRRDIRSAAPDLWGARRRSPARRRTGERPDLRTLAVLIAALGLLVAALAIRPAGGQMVAPATGSATSADHGPDDRRGPPPDGPGGRPPPPPWEVPCNQQTSPAAPPDGSARRIPASDNR